MVISSPLFWLSEVAADGAVSTGSDVASAVLVATESTGSEINGAVLLSKEDTSWTVWGKLASLASLAGALYSLFLVLHMRGRDPTDFKILLATASRLFGKKINTEVLGPVIRDLQDEYAEALVEKQFWKARFVQARGYFAFWSAVTAQGYVSLTLLVLKVLGAEKSNLG